MTNKMTKAHKKKIKTKSKMKTENVKTKSNCFLLNINVLQIANKYMNNTKL